MRRPLALAEPKPGRLPGLLRYCVHRPSLAPHPRRTFPYRAEDRRKRRSRPATPGAASAPTAKPAHASPHSILSATFFINTALRPLGALELRRSILG